MTLRAISFSKYCDEFPEMRANILLRGMIRRAHFKNIENNLQEELAKFEQSDQSDENDSDVENNNTMS